MKMDDAAKRVFATYLAEEYSLLEVISAAVCSLQKDSHPEPHYWRWILWIKSNHDRVTDWSFDEYIPEGPSP